MSKLIHHVGRILKKTRINITGRAGALMDLFVPKSAGYSSYTVWRKPRLNT
jgi:hypothetical protein